MALKEGVVVNVTDDRSDGGGGGGGIRTQAGDECINVSQAPSPMMEAN